MVMGRARDDEYNYATNATTTALKIQEKNLAATSYDQMQFMTIYLTENTCAAKHHI